MHELSVAAALLRQVESEAVRKNATSVRSVTVRLGALSGVDPDLLETAYAVARANTLCAEAELRVVRVPVQWTCPVCEEAVPEGAELSCPACGLSAVLKRGDELLLEQIELEVVDV